MSRKAIDVKKTSEIRVFGGRSSKYQVPLDYWIASKVYEQAKFINYQMLHFKEACSTYKIPFHFFLQ